MNTSLPGVDVDTRGGIVYCPVVVADNSHLIVQQKLMKLRQMEEEKKDEKSIGKEQE